MWMPSSDDCVFKAEQIARGDWQMKRLSKALSLAMGWPMRCTDQRQDRLLIPAFGDGGGLFSDCPLAGC
jgi:hypothetical protein